MHFPMSCPVYSCKATRPSILCVADYLVRGARWRAQNPTLGAPFIAHLDHAQYTCTVHDSIHVLYMTYVHDNCAVRVQRAFRASSTQVRKTCKYTTESTVTLGRIPVILLLAKSRKAQTFCVLPDYTNTACFTYCVENLAHHHGTRNTDPCHVNLRAV